jgi:hypothetical protein
MQTDLKYISGRYEFRIWQANEGGDLHIDRRPINASTGKPWQKSQHISVFAASEKPKAFRTWLYAAKTEGR